MHRFYGGRRLLLRFLVGMQLSLGDESLDDDSSRHKEAVLTLYVLIPDTVKPKFPSVYNCRLTNRCQCLG